MHGHICWICFKTIERADVHMQHNSVVFIYASQSSLGINAIKIHTCILELPSILIFRNKIISNTRKQNISDAWPENKIK